MMRLASPAQNPIKGAEPVCTALYRQLAITLAGDHHVSEFFPSS